MVCPSSPLIEEFSLVNDLLNVSAKGFRIHIREALQKLRFPCLKAITDIFQLMNFQVIEFFVA